MKNQAQEMKNMKKILFIDAYDSFVYSLYQYFGELSEGKAELLIYRNDKITIQQIKSISPDCIILSPGPGHPKDSGFVPIIISFPSTPIFGVCLGLQALGLAYGGKIERANSIMHGKTSEIRHDGKNIFKGVKNPFTATRYHSLIVAKLPACLEISARDTQDNYIMGARHRKNPHEGVQFHPESILTDEGKKIIANFLKHYVW